MGGRDAEADESTLRAIALCLYRLFMLFIGSFIHAFTFVILGVAASRCLHPLLLLPAMRIICLINHATIAKILAKDTKVSGAL